MLIIIISPFAFYFGAKAIESSGVLFGIDIVFTMMISSIIVEHIISRKLAPLVKFQLAHSLTFRKMKSHHSINDKSKYHTSNGLW